MTVIETEKNNCNLTETDNYKRKTLTETEKSKLK